MTDIYVPRAQQRAAKQWNGDNFAEIEEFFLKWVGPHEDTGLRNEPFDETINGRRFHSNTVDFYDGSDDMEVDPGRWIVVHLSKPRGEKGRIEVFHPEAFTERFEEATAE